MNRVDRLLALILHLQSKRVVTAEALAQHFELSIRTIYRDLGALAEVGVLIVAEAGVGYMLLKGYHLLPVNFTVEEANALGAGKTESTMVLAIAALLAGCATAPKAGRTGKLNHIGLFWLKDPGNLADRQKLIDAAHRFAREICDQQAGVRRLECQTAGFMSDLSAFRVPSSELRVRSRN